MLDGNKVIRDVLRFAEESGAGLTKFVGRKQDNTPLYAVLVIRGEQETAEILGAVEAIEARWDAEIGAESEPDPDSPSSPASRCSRALGDDFGQGEGQA
jgi:hypothetical protein